MTFKELQKDWRLKYNTYKDFIDNYNYNKAKRMLNSDNAWILRMILNNNIVISNIQDFRFITGSAGYSDWTLYKLLLKLSKKNLNKLLKFIVIKYSPEHKSKLNALNNRVKSSIELANKELNINNIFLTILPNLLNTNYLTTILKLNDLDLNKLTFLNTS